MGSIRRSRRGEERDVVVAVAEAGGIWVLDRATGQFIWATPFPLDVPDFHISHIDVETGRTHMNWDKVKKNDGDRVLVCFHNTRSFWSTAYHPGTNSLYIPYHDACLDMTENYSNPAGFGPRRQIMRPGSDPEDLRIDREGESVDRQGRSHSLATDPWKRVGPGDGRRSGVLGRHGSAFPRFRRGQRKDPAGRPCSAASFQRARSPTPSTDVQYVAVITGDAQSGTAGLLGVVRSFKPVRGHNAIYVFALPE